LGAGLLPIADDAERNGVVIGGASLWLVAGKPPEEQQAALDFVLYMTNTENMVSWHKQTGYYPVRTSSIEALEAEGWFEENPNYRVAFDQLLNTQTNTATAGALSGNMQELRTIVAETMQRCCIPRGAPRGIQQQLSVTLFTAKPSLRHAGAKVLHLYTPRHHAGLSRRQPL
jgi:sn-glycerol 3-phosphate transport system substrate-binding protein